MVKIDLESAFHHIQVDQDFRPFLGFTFNHKYYQYKAMCFGVKHAPIIFLKTLRPVIKFIREVLHVRITAYCDDIIILHQNQEELIYKIQLIINILTNFGFKISMNKSTKEDKPNVEQMEKDCSVSSNGKSEILGQLYRVSEFPATTIQERQNPSEEVKQDQIMGGPVKRLECIDNSEHVGIQGDILVEVDGNKKQTDLSYNSPSSGNISNRCESYILGSDAENARTGSGTAAILCALRRSVSYLKERQIKSLKIETDNSSAAYNINRGSAAVALAKLVDRTLETAEVLNLQLHAFHIPGVTNRISDSFTRLATSGNYSLHQEVFEEALRSLRTRPSIDMFANRKNRKLKRFVSLTLDSWAVGIDCMSLPWKGELPYLQPPLPMIQANAQQSQGGECCSIDRSAKLAIPIMMAKSDGAINQLCQPGKKHRRFETRGQDEESYKASSTRRVTRSSVRCDRGEELFKWILSKRQFPDDAIQQVIDGWHSIWSIHRQRIGEFEEFWTKSGKLQEDLTTVKDPETVISNLIAQQISVHATNANSNACRTAVGMLFRIQGFQEERMNGFALKQNMKKTLAATRKKRKEEPIYKLDILLKHIQERAVIKQKLNEQEHLGCTISSIMAFITLRLAEIYRDSVVEMEDNVWQLNTSIWKGDNYYLTVTFRLPSNSK
ncbi:MAG: hypothetical protein EZS28_023605, partial [Streblomastix strix]